MFESFAGQIFEKIEPKNYTPESQVKLYAGVTGK